MGVPMFTPAEPVPFMNFNTNNQAFSNAGAGAYAQPGGQPAYAQGAYPPPSAYAPPPAYGGTFGAASTFGRAAASRFEDEPPLLEGVTTARRRRLARFSDRGRFLSLRSVCRWVWLAQQWSHKPVTLADMVV